MQLVVVTYTHNDSELLNGLLKDILRWHWRPKHVFVIDDASTPPYVLPEGIGKLFPNTARVGAEPGLAEPQKKTDMPGLDVVRPITHLGPAQAKSFGIDLAFDSGADVVLSIDCDVRIHKDWLKKAVALLFGLEAVHTPNPAARIGLVGADLAHGLSGDTLSRYLRAFEQPEQTICQVPFLGAGVWLLRRDVWQACGGLQEYEQTTHEDLFFCRKLHNLGLSLLAANHLPATQVRRLRRTSYFLRELRYLGLGILRVAQTHGIQFALAPLQERANFRCQQAQALHEPGFVYLELLWLTGLLVWLTAEGAIPENPSKALPKIANELACLLASAPGVLDLLKKDLLAMHLIDANFTWATVNETEQTPQKSTFPEPGSEPWEESTAALVPWLLCACTHAPHLLEANVQCIEKEDDTFVFCKHYLEDA